MSYVEPLKQLKMLLSEQELELLQRLEAFMDNELSKKFPIEIAAIRHLTEKMETLSYKVVSSMEEDIIEDVIRRQLVCHN